MNAPLPEDALRHLASLCTENVIGMYARPQRILSSLFILFSAFLTTVINLGSV
jgi:hypothetical protein